MDQAGSRRIGKGTWKSPKLGKKRKNQTERTIIRKYYLFYMGRITLKLGELNGLPFTVVLTPNVITMAYKTQHPKQISCLANRHRTIELLKNTRSERHGNYYGVVKKHGRQMVANPHSRS